MVHRANSGHIGGSLGAADLIVALYFHLMRHDSRQPAWAARDRLNPAKGHCTPVHYAALAESGYFPVADLATFRRPGSYLQGHPYQPKTPGVDASTGTLRLGLSTATGMALAGKLRNGKETLFVLCDNGESQEGQIGEAAMFASKYRLNHLIALTDRNRLQTDGNTEEFSGSVGYTAATWHRSLQILAQGRVRLGDLITHRPPLDRWQEGFTAAENKSAGKVMLLPAA